MTSLTNKVAIVTGASRGIGCTIAERLAVDGASVVINYVQSRDKAQEVVAAVEAKGSQALAVQADLTQIADISRLFQETIERFGRLDILVNNASAPMVVKPIVEVTEKEFDYVFALNAKGTFFVLQEAARHLADGGRIVSLSSAATVKSPANLAVVSGSKATVEHFSMTLAKELGVRGITVNTVLPGPTATEDFKNFFPPEAQDELARKTLLGRLGQPQDIADVVAFLVSDEARWLTGQNIRATGGYV